MPNRSQKLQNKRTKDSANLFWPVWKSSLDPTQTTTKTSKNCLEKTRSSNLQFQPHRGLHSQQTCSLTPTIRIRIFESRKYIFPLQVLEQPQNCSFAIGLIRHSITLSQRLFRPFCEICPQLLSFSRHNFNLAGLTSRLSQFPSDATGPNSFRTGKRHREKGSGMETRVENANV